jgi:hypothetical protein
MSLQHFSLPRFFRILGFGAFSLMVGGLLPLAVAQAPLATQLTLTPAPQPLPEPYDRAIFQKTIPSDQLGFLNQFVGQPSYDLFRDKQFRKLMKSFVPDCMYHYGSDMSLEDSLEKMFAKSDDPVLIRDGRYVILSGEKGPYLGGRGFLWIDMQEGIGLGGFYSPAFESDMIQWTMAARVPPITTALVH